MRTVNYKFREMIVLVIIIIQAKNRLSELFGEPKNTLKDPVRCLWYNRILDISFDDPRCVKASQVFTCSLVQVECGILMFMQEGRRNKVCCLSFNTGFHNGSFTFRPSHNQDLFSLFDSVDTHRYSALGYFLHTSEATCCVFPGESVQINQPGDTVYRRRRFIKPNVPSSSNAQNLQVDSSIGLDFLFIVGTELDDSRSFDLAVRNIDVFLGDVNMIEEVVVHVVIVGFWVVFLDGVVFIQVEGNYVLETHLSIAIHADELTINSQWSITCSET